MSRRTCQSQAPLPSSRIQGLERLDVEAAEAAARHRRNPAVRTLGALSELADQVPLGTLCATVVVAGAVGGRPDLSRSGLRMLAAHTLANLVKRRIKNRLRRTRPGKMIEERDYRFTPGEPVGGEETSFPSGHTAGAAAVAGIIARDWPDLSLPAAGCAALIAAVQVPRAKHYPLDVAAGAALGLAAAWAVDRLLPGKRPSFPARSIPMPDTPLSDIPDSAAATASLTALFQTREAAETAIEHLVQQHGVNRADIFAEAEGDSNTAGNRVSGADRDRQETEADAPLRGAIRLSVDLAGEKFEAAEAALRKMGAEQVRRR